MARAREITVFHRNFSERACPTRQPNFRATVVGPAFYTYFHCQWQEHNPEIGELAQGRYYSVNR